MSEITAWSHRQSPGDTANPQRQERKRKILIFLFRHVRLCNDEIWRAIDERRKLTENLLFINHCTKMMTHVRFGSVCWSRCWMQIWLLGTWGDASQPLMVCVLRWADAVESSNHVDKQRKQDENAKVWRSQNCLVECGRGREREDWSSNKSQQPITLRSKLSLMCAICLSSARFKFAEEPILHTAQPRPDHWFAASKEIGKKGKTIFNFHQSTVSEW